MVEVKTNSGNIKRVFITVLGAGSYRETGYYMQDKPEKICTTKFAPIATLQLMENKPDIIIVLMTKKAKEVNWDAGMENALKEIGYENTRAYKSVIIPEGFTRGELERVVQIIFDEIPEGSRVYFDITHSFRHLPMLVMLLLHYAKVIKNIKVGGVYYGAFEVQADKKPVLDLGFFSELQDWTRVVARFSLTGNPEGIKDVVRKYYGKTSEVDWVENLLAFYDNILGCRGLKIMCCEEIPDILVGLNQIKKQPLLEPLVDIIHEKLEGFDYAGDPIRGDFNCGIAMNNLFSAIVFCYEHHLFQQGITLAWEFWPVLLILYNQRQLPNRGSIYNYELEIKKFINKESNDVYEELVNLLGKMQGGHGNVDKLGRILKELKDTRNDFNHGGFDEKSKSITEIEKILYEFISFTQSILPEDPEELEKLLTY